MNVAELTDDRAQARYKLYLEACRQRPRNREDEQLKRAYRALSKGRRVIDLYESIKLGGRFETGYPKLAIARADARRVRFYNGSDEHQFEDERYRSVRVPACLPPLARTEKRFDANGAPWWATPRLDNRALVPTMPPDVRPQGRHDRYFILWEADWSQPPVDPLLLQPLSPNGRGPLYIVLAAWDLTPLERSILRERQLTR